MEKSTYEEIRSLREALIKKGIITQEEINTEKKFDRSSEGKLS